MMSLGNVVIGGGVLGLFSATYWIWKQIKNFDRSYLKDKVVVITGASSGVGEACAKLFFRLGSKVILCARRKDELERVKNILMNIKLKQGIPRHEPDIVVLDLEDFANVEKKVQEIISRHHSIDILINNAGISSRGDVLSTSLEVFMKLININYIGQVAITKAVLPHMVNQKSGHIITVSSIQGKIAIPYRSAYSASKHAIQAFCDSLRAEVSHLNIHITVLSPGYINTNLSVNALSGDGSKYGITDSATQQGMSAYHIASCIAQAACHQNKEVVIGQFSFKLAIYLRNIMPSIYFLIMKRRAAKQRRLLTKTQ